MSAYFAILEKDPDSRWGVWFPDLPGCVAAGETDQDAVSNAVSALRDWVETARADEVIPTPSGIEDIRRHEDVIAARDSFVSVIRVPLLANRKTPTRINISIDAGILDAIDHAAKAHGMTRSGYLAAAAEEKLLRSA